MYKPMLLLFIWGLIPNPTLAAPYKLAEAQQKKLVQATFSGALTDTTYRGEYTSHYGPCMAMQLTNSTNAIIDLNLEYGYMLEPADTALQTMIVTQTVLVKLQPRQTKNYRVFAMCTQAHDKGPSPDKNFALRKRATGNLLALSELINGKQYQSDAAQNAVWCLTNNYELSSIHSEDTAMMYTLRRFVAKAKGIGTDKIYPAAYQPHQNNEPLPETEKPARSFNIEYSGSLNYSSSKTSKVTIALFDADNRLKKTYIDNETQSSGEHTFTYKISGDEMDNKPHYLRLIRDGRLEEEISIIPKDF